MKYISKAEVISLTLVLILLIAIALPNFIRPRFTRVKNTCIAELKQIEGAKEQFALEHNQPVGAQVHWTNLVPEYIKLMPECPMGGTYTIGAIGTAPTCTVKGHVMP